MTAVRCIHHYVLPSIGATVVGVCRKCGATKEFVNTAPEATAYVPGNGGRRTAKSITIVPAPYDFAPGYHEGAVG